MEILTATLVIFAILAIVMLAMSVGVIFSGRRLQGSCGGSGEDCACTEAERETCTKREPSTIQIS